MLEDLFTSSCQKLRDESRRLGLPENFRFLTNSREAFRPDIPALILDNFPSPNPFGKKDPSESCEDGSAYVVECWKKGKDAGQADLQKRMQAFLRDLREVLQLKMTEDRFAALGILSAYYNPFRNGKAGDKQFLEDFWKPVLDAICPPLFFAFAAPARDMLYKHFGIDTAYSRSSCLYDKNVQGVFSIAIHRVSRGDRFSLIISIPSLSRYDYGNYNTEPGKQRKVYEMEMWNIIKEFLAAHYSQSQL